MPSALDSFSRQETQLGELKLLFSGSRDCGFQSDKHLLRSRTQVKIQSRTFAFRRSTPMLMVHLAGLISAVAYLWLFVLSRAGQPVPLTQFLAAVGIATAAGGLAYWTLRHGRVRNAGTWVVVWGLVFRGIGFFGEPLYEDDFFRYLWDGRTLALGENPYLHPPARSFGRDLIEEPFEEILSGINYPEISSVYGPTCQWIFRAAYSLDPGKLWPLKLILLLADLTAAGCLLRLLDRKQYLLIYVWCPLLIKEVAFTAHVEILGVAFAVAALALAKARKPALASVALGLATGAKVLAALLVPFLLLRQRPKYWLHFAATLALLYAPFVWSGATEIKGLAVMARYWEFNSFGYAVLSALASAEVARIAGLGLFAAGYLWYLWKYHQEKEATIPRADWIFAAFFFLSPVVNPWYLLWMLPFVALRPTLWGIAALTAVMLSYVTGQNIHSTTLDAFDHPVWVRPLEILPVILALCFEPVRKAMLAKQRANAV